MRRTEILGPQADVPLVVHVVYRFDVGGLENGVVNLVNRMPRDRYRHAIVALTDVSSTFAARLDESRAVPTTALHKPPGHGWRAWGPLRELLGRWRPAIVHTRNLAALEMAPLAWAGGVAARVHGEHGRDASDPDGSVRRYQWVRRMHRPFVDHYVGLSRDLVDYLIERVGVPRTRVTQIINGVDTQRFAPLTSSMGRSAARRLAEWPFVDEGLVVVGTVGRMQTVKNQPLLAHAFVRALRLEPSLRDTLRLVMIGDGPLRASVERILEAANCRDLAWLPGARHDVAAQLRAFDVFVLPSQAEGISNTILEAMACGVPVVATDVGGNRELVEDQVTGVIVPSDDATTLARQMVSLALDARARVAYGAAGRQRVCERFSLDAMVDAYTGVYDHVLRRPTQRDTRNDTPDTRVVTPSITPQAVTASGTTAAAPTHARGL
jgi:sugar transferase (PEP-CTERM/EpsH1 system associated)